MVLTVSFALSRVIGLSCHPRLRSSGLRKLNASVEASGPHDFAVRKPTPSSEAQLASTASRPAFVTIAKRPFEERDGGINKTVSTKPRSEIFFATGLDTNLQTLPVGQISFGLSTDFRWTGYDHGTSIDLARLLRTINLSALSPATRS
jgi:hypothetical protein